LNASPPPVRLRDGLLAQDEVLEQFSRALREEHLAHAYLLLGPRGGGKLRTALALAQQLLCLRSDAPCGACTGCLTAAHVTHPDLHVLFPGTREEAEDPEAQAALLEAYAADRYHLLEYSASASIGIDRIRTLKEEVAMSRVVGERRVVILSDAPRLTEQAAQSALKLVEEPPAQTILLLTAEDSSQLLPTLVSRCQRLRLRGLPRETLVRLLESELGLEASLSRLLAALAAGSLGRALECGRGEVLSLRDAVLDAFTVPPEGLPAREVERRIQALERSRVTEQAQRAGELLLLWYGDLVAAHAGLPAESLGHADRARQAAQEGPRLGAEEIARRLRAVEEMMQACRQNVNPALALHVALTRVAARPGDEGYLF